MTAKRTSWRMDWPRHRKSARILLPCLAALNLMAGPARAENIPVDNPSFEILPDDGLPYGCGDGCSYSEEVIPGWTNIPFLGLGLTSGQFRPGTDVGNTAYFEFLSDGPTSAYTTTGCISQTLGVTVQEGVVYTLLADVGWRRDVAPTGLPRLVINDVFYDGTGTPMRGGWATFTTTYVGQAEDVGLPITICLSSVTMQGNFDNIRMMQSTPSDVDPTILPSRLELDAHPNPFRTATHVYYSAAAASPVVLQVFDVSGRIVRTLDSGKAAHRNAGEIVWDGTDDAGKDVSTGVYLIRLSNSEVSRTSRVLLVR